MEWIITVVLLIGIFIVVGIESGRKQAQEELEEAERMEYYNPNKSTSKRRVIHVKGYMRYS